MNDLVDFFIRPITDGLGRIIAENLGESLQGWLRKDLDEPLAQHDGRSIARYGRRCRVVTSITAAFALAITITVLCSAPGHGKWVAIPFLMFFVASAWSLLDVMSVRIEFNRDELYVRTCWQGRHLVPWSAVRGWSYSALGSRLIDAGDYGKIPVGMTLPGGSALLAICKFHNRDGVKRVPGKMMPAKKV